MYRELPKTTGNHKRAKSDLKRVALALQGGGSHGAFSWGALDRLLEDGRFEIEGITGTSIGGMNAIAVAQGLMNGGNQIARDELKTFWQRVSDSGKNSTLNNRGPIDKMLGKYTMSHSPGYIIFDYLSRIFSPYELNPLQIDPLKEVIAQSFDFEKLREFKGCKTYLCATHVYTGKLRVFGLNEITPDCLQATICLPTIHNAVLVEGEYYWDGGLIGNPLLLPLIYECETPDIILIQLNPIVDEKLPVTSREIVDRLNEITNNSSVIREMRSISLINDLIEAGMLDSTKVKKTNLHVIEDEECFQELGWSSKLNTEWEFVTYLFEKGRAAADRWIKQNCEQVGKKSTARNRDLFLGDHWQSK